MGLVFCYCDFEVFDSYYVFMFWMVDKMIGGNWFDDVNSIYRIWDVIEKLRIGFFECVK